MYSDDKKAEMHANLDRYYENAQAKGYGDGDGLATGEIAPMFEDTTGATGGGKQYDMPLSMEELENIGMISEVEKRNILKGVVMVKAELLRWYASIETDKMPRYIEISDANESQIFLNGCWQNAIYVWSILFDGKNWKYVETDSDRGYVFDLKSFSSENEAVEYAKLQM